VALARRRSRTVWPRSASRQLPDGAQLGSSLVDHRQVRAQTCWPGGHVVHSLITCQTNARLNQGPTPRLGLCWVRPQGVLPVVDGGVRLRLHVQLTHQAITTETPGGLWSEQAVRLGNRSTNSRYSAKDNSGTSVHQQKTCHVILPHNTAMLLIVGTGCLRRLLASDGAGELLDRTSHATSPGIS
jgi:hypothetical protein